MYQSTSTILYCTIFIVFIKIIFSYFYRKSIPKSNYFCICLFIKFFIKNRFINFFSSIALLFDQEKRLELLYNS